MQGLAEPLKPHEGTVGPRRVLPERLQREHSRAPNLTSEFPPPDWEGIRSCRCKPLRGAWRPSGRVRGTRRGVGSHGDAARGRLHAQGTRGTHPPPETTRPPVGGVCARGARGTLGARGFIRCCHVAAPPGATTAPTPKRAEGRSICMDPTGGGGRPGGPSRSVCRLSQGRPRRQASRGR